MPSTHIRIVPSDRLDDDQRRRLFEWDEDVFCSRGTPLEWEAQTRHFLVYVDDELMAHTGIVERMVTVGDQRVNVIGIASVVTRGEAQRQGHATAAIEAALAHGQQHLRTKYGMLFCRPPLEIFYGKRGWQTLKEPVLITQSSGIIRSPLVVMVRLLTQDPWPPGPVTSTAVPGDAMGSIKSKSIPVASTHTQTCDSPRILTRSTPHHAPGASAMF